MKLLRAKLTAVLLNWAIAVSALVDLLDALSVVDFSTFLPAEKAARVTAFLMLLRILLHFIVDRARAKETGSAA